MIGAEPSATTVPTATPFTAVPAKNAGWYASTPTAPITTSSQEGSGCRVAAPGVGAADVPVAPRRRPATWRARATSPSAPPPMRMRAAPTDAELASGPSAWAVPVVPKHTEARSTAITNRIPYCYTILRAAGASPGR